MKPSLYLGLCTEFFDLDKPVPTLEEYAFFHHYIAQANGPILEPMCGTGRYLIPYLQEGFDIDGFDASPFMLNALYRKCEQYNLKPHVWEQFLEEVSAHKLYNLIFIPDSSFSLFLDLIQIKTCLHTIYSLLEKGGTFVFDVESIYAVPDKVGMWHGKAYKKSDGTTIMCSVLPLPIENNIATAICRYELFDATEIIKTEMEYFQIKLYHPTQMDELLKEVGFSHVKKVAAYNHALEPSPYDYTLVYECTK
ncbi:MAG TPA: class I SAM-dependent methyltransferase [Candidatus Babeliales bacterium]|nr:class I SAM-dependent methyltransferase [Candidatus Babeliales bacterium]